MGESYAGTYIPMLADRLAKDKKNFPQFKVGEGLLRLGSSQNLIFKKLKFRLQGMFKRGDRQKVGRLNNSFLIDPGLSQSAERTRGMKRRWILIPDFSLEAL